ncbi:hypothetical protein, partial [Polaromonas sp. UBA4122]|uniref:hypothetical protein n=1 Tax=Polaromonas sp. UBA4122 TaxID=1947074 RepID=UPI0025FF1227
MRKVTLLKRMMRCAPSVSQMPDRKANKANVASSIHSERWAAAGSEGRSLGLRNLNGSFSLSRLVAQGVRHEKAALSC